MSKSILYAGAAAFAFSAYAGQATAQGSPTEEDAEARLGVITVNARKTEENIQDAPVAVTAFDQDALFEQGIKDIEDLSRRTPGFVFDTPFGRQFDRPIIRGQANILGDSGVSVFIDGVNVTQSIRSLNFGDIDTIEIIKGPQSALFGRNTYSGAINITTRQPSNEVGVDLSVEAGEYGLFQALGNVSGPIVDDRLFYNLSARYYTFDSEFDDDTLENPNIGNEESITLAGSLTAMVTNNWEVTTRLAYNKDNDGHFPIGLLGFEDLNVNVPGGTQLGGNQPFFDGVVRTMDPNPSGSSQLSDTLGEGGGIEREEFFLSLNSEYEFANGYSVFTTLGYTHEEFQDELDSDGRLDSFGTASVGAPIPIAGGAGVGVLLLPFDFTTTDDDETETYVAEIRLDSPQDQAFRWRVGGYYFNDLNRDQDLLQRFNDPRFNQAAQDSFDLTGQQIQTAAGAFFHADFIPFSPLGPSDPRYTRRENISVFGSIAYDFSPQLTATLEARYAEEDVTERTFDFGTGVIQMSNGLDLDFNETFTAFTPRLTVDYQIDDDHLLYGVIANGTKPGGFNGAQGFEFGFGTFDEEELWQYEVGSKNYFLDNQMLLNGSVYFSQLDGYQLTENLAALGATSTTGSVTANLGEVEIFGIELETAFTPNTLPNLTVGGTYAYTDAEFTSGQEGTQEAVFGDGDLTGQQVPRQAPHQVSFFGEYTVDFDDVRYATFAVNGNYLDSRFAQVQNLAETGESFEVDARVTFGLNDRTTFSIWGKNLTDEDAALGVLRFIDPRGGNGSLVVNGVNIENGFTLSSAGQSRGFQYNNRNGRRFGAILRYKF